MAGSVGFSQRVVWGEAMNKDFSDIKKGDIVYTKNRYGHWSNFVITRVTPRFFYIVNTKCRKEDGVITQSIKNLITAKRLEKWVSE